MPKVRNFVTRRDAQPQSASDADFEALFARHARPHKVQSDDIPIERIQPNPFQARQTFAGIDELAQAIRVQGFTTRLRVRRDPHNAGMFQLVYGERRLRAARAAGLETVPCDVAEHEDAELIEIGLAENIQREDLDPLEEARAFRTFVDERGYTISRLAERLGKDRGYVESRLALLRTPADVQAMVVQRRDTVRAAREIAKLRSIAARRPLIDGVLSGELSTGDVRSIVRGAQDSGSAAHEQEPRRSNESGPTAGSVERQIERDAHTIAAILGHWEQQLPALSTPQRRRLRALLTQQLAQLQRLVAAGEQANRKR